MKFLTAAALILCPAAAALAATGPQPLGNFGAWTAASYGSGAAKACYAFTPAKTSSPKLAGRGPVLLTVTQRKAAADEVTLSAGYHYPKAAKVTLTIGSTAVDFYTAGENAFTTGGAKAVAAFQSGDSASAKSTPPKGKMPVVDVFSLAGFSGAYKAILKACP